MPAVESNLDVQSQKWISEQTKGIRHSGREFADHLQGTYRLLVERGNPQHVCLAGLFHSVYGTNSFKVRQKPSRSEVTKIIGEKAEALVHIFCTNDRPEAFINDVKRWPPSILVDLLEIERANLIEQGINADAVILRMDFERCWPWIEGSLEFGAYKHNGKVWPTHRKEHVWQRIADGRALFWPGKTCVFVTEFINSPTGLKSHNFWLVGGNLKEILTMYPEVEDWGRQNGCHRQLSNGRRGWLRVVKGYEELGVTKQKDLMT